MVIRSGKAMGSALLDVPVEKYKTWYGFKKDLESFCGHPVLNKIWLQIKPQSALPWDKTNMRLSILKLGRIGH